jgi:hypothetical protein
MEANLERRVEFLKHLHCFNPRGAHADEYHRVRWLRQHGRTVHLRGANKSEATQPIRFHSIGDKMTKVGRFIFLLLAVFVLASAVTAQQTSTQTSTQTCTHMATLNQPGQVNTAPANFIVTTVPVFSTATIISITNDGSTSVMNCTVFECGLAVGNQIELGEALAVGTNCEGPHTISAVSGNTASFSSANCVASAGPYANAIGQWAPALALTNAVAGSGDLVEFMVNYDDQFFVFAVHGGVTNSELVLDTDGQIQLVSPFFGNVFGITKDSKVCLGYAPSATTATCQGAGFDSSSGAGQGVLTSYKGLAQTAGHGLPYVVYSSGNSAGHSSTLGPVNIWQCPASGYGSSDQYELKATAVATAGVAESTMQLSVGYTDVSGTAQSKSSESATSFAITGANIAFDQVIQCSPSTLVSFTATESGAATYAVTVSLILN